MRRLAVILSVSLAFACKGDKPSSERATAGSGSAAGAVSATTDAMPGASARDSAGSGSGSGSRSVNQPAKHADAPKPIELPKSPDTPPNKTTKPLDRPALEKLAALEFGSFVKIQRGFTDKFLELRHITKDRPKLGIMITIQPCDKAKAACVPIDLQKWTAKGDALKQFLSPDLKKRPDTVFVVGLSDIGGGAKAFYTYQAGYFVGKDDKGDPVGDYTDAYVLYYNDGINQIRVNAHYLDDSPGSLKAMLEIAPEEDLERLAVAFLKYYVHQW